MGVNQGPGTCFCPSPPRQKEDSVRKNRDGAGTTVTTSYR
jgi:hypothetical protein